MPVEFRGQSYSSIKKDCLNKGVLFEDPEFPATSKSLYFTKIANDITWMRPREICKVPRLMIDGGTCDDLITGEINNSWFITACAGLSSNHHMWKMVIPDAKAQEFDEKNGYAGIFKFHFWRFGETVEVVIDDRLPTRDGQLAFIHSKQKNEFWSALLEKAYAKMFGDYETLQSGHPSDALVDFSGGVSEKLETFNMKLGDSVERRAFFNKMEAASENKALINCIIRCSGVPPRQAAQQVAQPINHGPAKLMDVNENDGPTETPQEPPQEPQQAFEKPPPPVEPTDTNEKKTTEPPQETPQEPPQEPQQAFEIPPPPVEGPHPIGSNGPYGLAIGLGYNITAVRGVKVPKSMQALAGGAVLELVKLYNPWQGREWTGPWSDTSKEWKSISASEWSKMGVKFEREGEFWMSFDDFCRYFTDVDICHFVNTSFFSLKKTWVETISFSKWSSAGRNGGNVWDALSFLSNPQFLFDINTEGPDTIMVSLEQRDVTAGRVSIGENKNTVGFYIMKVEINRQYRVHIKGDKMFRSDFLKSRNVFGTCTLPRGRFVIIPCCENPGGEGEFMLRLYTTNKCAGRELTLECPKTGCCAAQSALTTTITIDNIDGLALPEGAKGTLDPYVVVKCEGEKVQSDAQKDNRSPKFDLMATFYRKKPSLPIIVEVYNQNKVFDDYLCEAKVDWPDEILIEVDLPPALDSNGNEMGDRKVYNLFGRGKEADVMKPGNLTVFIRSSDDPQML